MFQKLKRKLNPLDLFGKLTVPFSPLLKAKEKRIVKKYGSSTPRFEPVFVIGAPRTGSTILNQVLTNKLDVCYTNNIAHIFCRNLLFGFYLSKKIYNNGPHNIFRSNHGNTYKEGLNAPSECGTFWYRWIKEKGGFIDYDDIKLEHLIEIKSILNSIIKFENKPLVFTNNNIALRMRMISQMYPNAKFIFVTRKPFFTCQSIINVRKKVHGSPNIWWSLKPPNYKSFSHLDYPEQVVGQVYGIEKQIYQDRKNFPPSNFLVITYEKICSDLNSELGRIRNFIDETTTFRLKAENYFPQNQNRLRFHPIHVQQPKHLGC